MAGAASFTHVHDWTMHNAPPGTGGWFGWANAIISELTPTAAGIEIRRRKRQHRTVAYPMAVLIAAAVLSLAAQVAQARPSLTGWLLAAVPALAFLALHQTHLLPHPAHQATTPALPRRAPTPSLRPLPAARSQLPSRPPPPNPASRRHPCQPDSCRAPGWPPSPTTRPPASPSPPTPWPAT